jgi:hypothetical protein
MGISSWIASKIMGKKRDARVNHDFTTEDYWKSQLSKLKRLREKEEMLAIEEEIEDIETGLYGEESEEEESQDMSAEQMLLNMFMKAQQNNHAQVPPQSQPLTQTAGVVLQDSEIMEQLQDTPPGVLSQLKSISAEKRRDIIVQQFPQLSKDTVDRAVSIIEAM